MPGYSVEISRLLGTEVGGWLDCFRLVGCMLKSRPTMKTLNAKVLDSTHLELTEPLHSAVGDWVQIVVAQEDSEGTDWRRAAEERLLAAYDDHDAIYDEI